MTTRRKRLAEKKLNDCNELCSALSAAEMDSRADQRQLILGNALASEARHT